MKHKKIKSNKVILFVLIALIILSGVFVLINDHEGITSSAILENGIITILADTTNPVIELNASTVSNITTNTTYELWANFTDDDSGFVGNITLNELSDDSTSENLTFTGNENQTVYLKIPKGATVINATINVSGRGEYCYQEDPTSYGFDAPSGYYLMNYTIPGGANISSLWRTKVQDGCPFSAREIAIDQSCWDWALANNNVLMFREYPGSQYCWNGTWITLDRYSHSCGSGGNPASCLDVRERSFDGDWSTYSVPVNGRFCGNTFGCGGACFDGYQDLDFYEEAMLWANIRCNSSYNNINLSNNSYLEVGTVDGTHEWNHSGEFNGTNNTSDFSSAINSNLSGCTADNLGYCLVPLLFHSDSAGILEISNINITYYSNRSCEVCVASDGVCDTEWTINNVTMNYTDDNLSGNCSYSWNITNNSTDANYNISFRIKDIAGNNATSSTNITLDRNSPVFEYAYPLDNGAFNMNVTNTTNRTLTFLYYVNDLSSIANCSFMFNRVLNQTDTSVQINARQEFNLTLPLDTLNDTYYYNWSLNCTDIFDYTSSIGTRNFTLIVVGNFTGSTTDLTTVNTSNITNLTFEEVDYGRIQFYQTVALRRVWDIYKYISITNNRLEINTTAVPELNTSALLYLYDLTYTNPRILIDGIVCPPTICTKIDYTGGTLTFNVTQFSVFTSEESPVSVSGGGGGSSGTGGTTPTVCSVGAIQCVGEIFYRECLRNDSVNIWGETKSVLAGKICEFGTLKDMEEEEEVAEVEEIAEEESVEEVEEQVESVSEKKLNYFLLLIIVLLIGFGYLIWHERKHFEKKKKKKKKPPKKRPPGLKKIFKNLKIKYKEKKDGYFSSILKQSFIFLM